MEAVALIKEKQEAFHATYKAKALAAIEHNALVTLGFTKVTHSWIAKFI